LDDTCLIKMTRSRGTCNVYRLKDRDAKTLLRHNTTYYELKSYACEVNIIYNINIMILNHLNRF